MGSANQASDNGYASKVLLEQGYLKNVAGGKSVPATAPLNVATQAPPVAPTYLCPGNLLTNQMDAAQAQAQKCVLAGSGRLSQASFQPAAPMAPAMAETTTATSSPRSA